MRKLWLLPLLLLLAPLVTVGVLLYSPATLTAALQRGVTTFTPLQLELSGLDLSLREWQLQFDSLHLRQKAADGAPLLTVMNFTGATHPRDLLEGEFRRTEISADSLIVYVAANDAAEDPTPQDWLQYLRWLPKRFAVAQVHLISDAREVSILPLQTLHGRREDDGGFIAGGQALVATEALQLDLELGDVRQLPDAATVSILAQISSVSGSRATLKGELRAQSDLLHYDLSMDAGYPAVEDFLAAFAGAPPLAGALRVSGHVTGNNREFTLSDAAFELDNRPDYHFQASGSLAGATGTDPALTLVAHGELASMDLLLRWVDIDLSPLGSARASIALSGTLAAPAVEQMTLVTSSSEGLWLSINGNAGPGSLGALQIPPDSDFTLYADAPGLAVIQPWLASPLPLDPGPWSATVRLREQAGKLQAEGLRARLGRPENLELTLSGTIATVNLQPGVVPLSGLDLQMQAAGRNLGRALQGLSLPFDLPQGLALTASANLLGDSDTARLESGTVRLEHAMGQLQLSEVSSTLHAEQAWQPADARGQLQARVSDSRALIELFGPDSELPRTYPASLSLRGQWQQTDARQVGADRLQLSLDGPGLALRASGSATRLLDQPAIRLSVDVDTLDPVTMAEALYPERSLPEPFTTLTGQLALDWQDQTLNVQQIDLRSTKDSRMQLQLSGALQHQSGALEAALSGQASSNDRQLLEQLSGLPMAPLQSDLNLNLEGPQLALAGDLQFGQSALHVDLRGTLEDAALSQLDIQLSAATLSLADLGLQADLEQENGYRPAQRLEDLDEEQRTLQALLDTLPRFPVELAVQIEHLQGQQSRFDQIRLALSGREGHYLLREFDFLYDDALAQLRGVVDVNVNPPGLSIAGDASRIPLNTLTRDLGFQNDISGILHLRTGLSGQGLDLDSLLGTLNGSLSVALEEATVAGAAYDVLATDLLSWLFSGAALESSTVIQCTMADFLLRDGVARSDNLYAASARMVAEGRAEFDLGRRTLDVALTPRSRSRRVEIPSRITLTGELASPRVWISPVTTTLDFTTELLVLVPRLFFKLLGIGRGDRFEDRACVLP